MFFILQNSWFLSTFKSNCILTQFLRFKMRIAALLLRSMAFLVLFSQLDAGTIKVFNICCKKYCLLIIHCFSKIVGIIVDDFGIIAPERPAQCYLKLYHNSHLQGQYERIQVNNTEWTTLNRAQQRVMSLEVMGPCEWEISS